MKRLLVLPALLFVVGACNIADDTDYEAVAKDTCQCVKDATDNLSPEAKDLIIGSNGDLEKFKSDFETYATEDPMKAMNDAMEMQKLAEPEFQTCIDGLKTKYDDVYSTDSEEEVQKKILEVLEDMDGCDITVAVFKIGIAEQGK